MTTSSTTIEILKLTTPFEIFKTEIEKLINESNELHKIGIENEEQFNDWKLKIKDWQDRGLALLESSFENKNNEFKREFYSAQSGAFNVPGVKITLQQEVDKLKKKIANKQWALWGNLRVLSVCDASINPDKINLEERQSYTINQKLNLLLEKLDKLYDNFYYPVKDILIGNGIILQRHDEDYDLAKILENKGFIEINNFGTCAVKLTTEGKMFVEENSRPVKANYGRINKSSEELNAKVDEIIETLKQHGYGQEIIFDELQELKELYTQVDKKTWGQVLKGKLIDLAVEKLVEPDTIKFIYKELTDQALLLINNSNFIQLG